jgi:hypothetical protein
MLLVGVDGGERGALIARVVEIGHSGLLTQNVVPAVAIVAFVVTENSNRERSRRCIHRGIAFGMTERAKGAFNARGIRLVDATFRDDVNDAADRSVAVEHRAAVAARDFDSFDTFSRNHAPIDAGQIPVIEPPAIDQNERVRRRGLTETAHIDRGAGAPCRSVETLDLDARFAGEKVRDTELRRTLDVVFRDRRRRRADDASPEPARRDVDRRQDDLVALWFVLRARSLRKQCERHSGAGNTKLNSHDATLLRLRPHEGGRIG